MLWRGAVDWSGLQWIEKACVCCGVLQCVIKAPRHGCTMAGVLLCFGDVFMGRPCTHIHTLSYTHTHSLIHTRAQTVYVYLYIYMYTCRILEGVSGHLGGVLGGGSLVRFDALALSSFSHTHIHTHTHTHTLRICMYTYAYTYTYIYTHISIYMYIYTHTHTHTGYSRERPDTSGGVIVMQEPSENGGKAKDVKMNFDGADMMAEDGCKALVMCIFMCVA